MGVDSCFPGHKELLRYPETVSSGEVWRQAISSDVKFSRVIPELEE